MKFPDLVPYFKDGKLLGYSPQGLRFFPMYFEYRGVDSVDFCFPPISTESLIIPDPIITVKYYDSGRDVFMGSSHAPDTNNIDIDEDLFKELVEYESRLLEMYQRNIRYVKFESLSIKDKLQYAGLLLAIAKGWEEWAHKMHAMFAGGAKEEADNQLEYIYINYIRQYFEDICFKLYQMSSPLLPSDMTQEQRQAWSRLLVYAQGKTLATHSLYADAAHISCYKEFCARANPVLHNNGFAHMVPDYDPNALTEKERDIYDLKSGTEVLVNGAKSLVWSVWNTAYGLTCGSHTQAPASYTHRLKSSTDPATDTNNQSCKKLI